MRSLTIMAVVGAASAAPSADAVPEMPGYGAPPSAMYSGYLDAKGTKAAPGCAVTEKECKLHYWYAEAFEDPASKPVVLWLNGGPGSSSILGMLQEHGPLLMNATGGLMKNMYAWNNIANVVVLESPTGVGYSYCSTQIAGGVCKNTDKLTAAAARAAMVDFFTTKFPELKSSPFYITGESYAGVYVPTLSKEILDNAKGQINFKGLMVGDPCTDNVAQKDSMDMLWYGNKYGFVPDQEYDLLWNKCSVRSPALLSRGRWAWGAGQEASTKKELFDLHVREHSLAVQKERYAKEHGGAPMSPECTIAYRKYLASSSKGFSQGWINAYINNLSLYGPSALVSMDLPGSLNYQTAQYMMRPDVQKALHVDSGPSKHWPDVKQGFDYTSDYAACNDDAAPGTPSMVDFYREIAPQLEVTLVMNGDTDPCVSYEGTRVALTRVGFAEKDGGGFRPWFYNHTETTIAELQQKPTVYGNDLSLTATGPQMGGLIVDYEHGLSFQTVHGAGHMVPQFRPQASLHQLGKVLKKGAFFAPLLPLNATLANMTDAQYDAALDAWTLAAKAAPFSS